MKRTIIVLSLLSMVLTACSQGRDVSPTPTSGTPNSTSAVEELPGSITANGVLLPNRRMELSFGANGFVETVEVEIGTRVEAGQTLARIDSSEALLTLQQAEAALATAQANYDLLISGIPAERQAALAAANLELISAQASLESLHEEAAIQTAKAFQRMVEVQNEVKDAQRYLNNMVLSADQDVIDNAYAHMILAQDKMEKAEEDFEPWINKPETNVTRAAYLSKVSQARETYKTAARRYSNLTGTASQLDIALARADLALAEAEMEAAQEQYRLLENGPNPDEIALAEARVALAQAQVSSASGSPTPEQLALVQADVDAARSNLEIQKLQTGRMVLDAPYDGVISAIIINPGEWVSPGDVAFEIIDISQWKIETKNVGELRIGDVAIGDPVRVRVNAFRDESLEGKVVTINPVAVVQQGDTTYTLMIALARNDLHLLPGMTARVEIP